MENDRGSNTIPMPNVPPAAMKSAACSCPNNVPSPFSARPLYDSTVLNTAPGTNWKPEMYVPVPGGSSPSPLKSRFSP